MILLDLEMDDMNGDVACARMRAGGYNAGPVVLVTGTPLDKDETSKMFDRGFTLVLNKMGKPSLTEALERYLDLKADDGDAGVGKTGGGGGGGGGAEGGGNAVRGGTAVWQAGQFLLRRRGDHPKAPALARQQQQHDRRQLLYSTTRPWVRKLTDT